MSDYMDLEKYVRQYIWWKNKHKYVREKFYEYSRTL